MALLTIVSAEVKPTSTTSLGETPPAAESEERDASETEELSETDGLSEKIASIEVSPTAGAGATSRDIFGQLALARLVDIDDDGAVISLGNATRKARLSPTLSAAVVRTALENGEPVLVERSADGSVVVMGALRTQATPGVDKMKEIELEADRIHIKGRQEVSLSTSGATQIALRAIGEIETYAGRIVSRAEEVHKIIGRMLRLN